LAPELKKNPSSSQQQSVPDFLKRHPHLCAEILKELMEALKSTPLDDEDKGKDVKETAARERPSRRKGKQEC